MRRVFFRPWSCTCVEGPLRRDEALKRCRIRSAVPDSRRRSALAVRDCLGITVGGNGTRACGTTDQASQQTCPVSESGMGLSPCARKRECSPLGEGAGVLTMFHVKHGWTTAMRGQAEAGRGGVKGFRRQLAVVRVTRRCARWSDLCHSAALRGTADGCCALRCPSLRWGAVLRASLLLSAGPESLLFDPRHFTAADFTSLNCPRPHYTVRSAVISPVLICALVI